MFVDVCSFGAVVVVSLVVYYRLLFQPRMCRRRTGRQRDVWARREDTSTPSHGRFMVKVLTGGFAGSAVASAATR